LTDLDENPKTAIKSVIAHKKFVKRVKIVYARYPGQDHSFYHGYAEDCEEIEVDVITKLDAKYFGNDDNVIIEIPPNCDMRLGDFQKLEEISKDKSRPVEETQFSLGTTFFSNTFNLMHGVIMIMMLMEWLIGRVFYFGKHISHYDIRGRFIIRKGNQQQYLSEPFKYRWNLIMNDVKRKEYECATIDITNNIRWLLYNNTTFAFGLWIFVYIPIYVFLSLSFNSVWFYKMSPWILLTITTTSWSFFSLASFLLMRQYIKVPYLFVYCILFPFYWISFPYILLYYKFS
jgi:hypothetical protein